MVRGGLFAPCVDLHGFIVKISGFRGTSLKDVLLSGFSGAPTTCLSNCSGVVLNVASANTLSNRSPCSPRKDRSGGGERQGQLEWDWLVRLCE